MGRQLGAARGAWRSPSPLEAALLVLIAAALGLPLVIALALRLVTIGGGVEFFSLGMTLGPADNPRACG
jgi:hypothetical protein